MFMLLPLSPSIHDTLWCSCQGWNEWEKYGNKRERMVFDEEWELRAMGKIHSVGFLFQTIWHQSNQDSLFWSWNIGEFIEKITRLRMRCSLREREREGEKETEKQRQ